MCVPCAVARCARSAGGCVVRLASFILPVCVAQRERVVVFLVVRCDIATR